MPTYEYLCEGCQKGFEVRLTITEQAKAHDVKCPGCGSKKVRPQVTVFTHTGVAPVWWTVNC
jgi:putative FmdB family regulatory protein